MINAKTVTWSERIAPKVLEYMIAPGVYILDVGEGILKWRHMRGYNVMLSTFTPTTRRVLVSMSETRDPEMTYIGQLRDEDAVWYIQYKFIEND